MAKERIDYMDYAKAICIMLMVACHAIHEVDFWRPVYNVIYQFHMPFFFFASGVFYKDIYTSHPLLCLRDKMKRLWAPHFIWNLLFLLMHNVLFNIGIYNESIGRIKGGSDYIKRIVRIAIFDYRDQLTGPMWFFAALFWSTIVLTLILYIINIFSDNNKNSIVHKLLPIFLIVLLFILGTVFKTRFELSKGLVGLLFFYAGYLYKRNHYKIPMKWYFCLIGIALTISISLINVVEISKSQYGNILLFVISAFCGIYAVLFVSQALENRKHALLSLLGRSTMYIVILNFASFKLGNYIIMRLFGMNHEALAAYPTIIYSGKDAKSIIFFTIYFAIGLIIPVCVCQMSNMVKRCLKR